jgi:hypothetical protein
MDARQAPTEREAQTMSFTVALELPDIEATDPIDAIRQFVWDVQRQPSLYIYEVTDDETGEREFVDMAERPEILSATYSSSHLCDEECGDPDHPRDGRIVPEN